MMTIFRRPFMLAALIPMAAQAQSFQNLDAVDAAAEAAAGQPVRPVDRRLKLVPCPEQLSTHMDVAGAVTVSCPLIGWRVRIALIQNEKPATAANIIIRRGDPVSVTFVTFGFSVSSSGIAESDARMGERVRVRVAQKADPVTGEATDVGTVRVRALN